MTILCARPGGGVKLEESTMETRELFTLTSEGFIGYIRLTMNLIRKIQLSAFLVVSLSLVFYPLHSYSHQSAESSSHCSLCHTGIGTAPVSDVAAPTIAVSLANPVFQETFLEREFSAPSASRAPPVL